MWIHILIFMVILGVFLAGKMGRLPPEAGNPEEKKLFIRIALTGNIIGMLLTFQSGGDKVYSSGYRMEKEETGAYEEKFKVSVDGEEAGSLYVQVPEDVYKRQLRKYCFLPPEDKRGWRLFFCPH